MWHSRPPRDPPAPLMANAILNFHFDYLNPSLIIFDATLLQALGPLRVQPSRPRCPCSKTFCAKPYDEVSDLVLNAVALCYSKQPKLAYICTFKNTQFWLFLAPPADPVEFFWF